MNILVIGGSGFIGTALIRELIALGFDVKNFDKKRNDEFKEITLVGDIMNLSALNEAVQGVDVLFHLAAEHRDDITPVSLYYDVNVQGARNIINAAEMNNVKKIIFTSTVAVYGLNKHDPDENSLLEPFNEYSKSKLQAEEVFIEWDKNGEERSLIIVRPAVIIGEGNKGNIYTLIKLIANNKFVMVGDGKNKKSMGYIGNIVKFLIKIIDLPEGVHIFNYADKPDMTTKELVELIKGELRLNSRPIIRLPYKIGVLGGYAFDILARITGKKYPISSIRIKKFCSTTTVSTKALERIGFIPPYSLKEGLKRMIKNMDINTV
jgi:nucleoside-diphosphate-sugar epimerase